MPRVERNIHKMSEVIHVQACKVWVFVIIIDDIKGIRILN